MVLFLILIVSEFLTFIVFRRHYKGISKTGYYLSTIINAILSCFLWILYLEVAYYKGDFDTPGHVWLIMALNGALCAIVFPRIILDLLHFTGKIIRYKRGGHIRSLTNTGIVIWIFILILVITGTLRGRHNYTTEEVSVKSDKPGMAGKEFKIVLISDLHLSSFYKHQDELRMVINRINSLDADLVINSGDFITYGWKEFVSFDTILSAASARYGSFAALGNHDIGTYHPHHTAPDIDTNIARLSGLIKASGYILLRDSNVIIKKDDLKIGIAGIITRGRRFKITYGDINSALAGLDSVDYRVLISHDPNYWRKEVAGKRDIDLTLSGHTHGMQMGIITKWLKWSPAEYFYDEWNGLYSSGGQYLYVNRGLGVLGMPFRIGMPPEITVIRISGSGIR